MGVKVAKFGGSSVADGIQLNKIKEIIMSDPERRYIVVSAPGKRFDGDNKITDLLYLVKTTMENMLPYDQLFQVICDRYTAAAMWSYYPDENHSRLKMKMYEFLRDIYLRIQNINRPELTVRGLAFGYYTENAMKEGYRVELLRGEDGSMALAMKKYGKIKFVYDKRCRVITGYGGLKEKSIFAAMWHRLKFYGIGRLFSKTDHYDDAPDNFLKAK